MNNEDLKQIAELEKRLTVTKDDLENTLRVLQNSKGTAKFMGSIHKHKFKREGNPLEWDSYQYYKDQANKIAEVIEIVKEQNQ